MHMRLNGADRALDVSPGNHCMTALRSPISEASLAFPGWRVLVGAVIGLAFSPGPLIFGSFGLFAPHMHDAYGWSRGQIMLALTFFNIAGVLASPITGSLIDRLGVRRILFPALIAFLLGFLAIAFAAHSLTALYVIAFLWGGLTVGTQSISYTKLITGWFATHRGLAVGISAAGLGLGYTIVPILVGKLLAATDWHMALAALSLVVIALPMLFNSVLARPNPELVTAGSSALSGMTLQQARATSVFWRIAASILLASTALTGVVPHIALLVIDRGFSASQAAMVASTYGLSTIIGRIIVGWLADRVAVSRVAIGFFALSGIGFVLAGLFAGSGSLSVLMLVALTIGFGFGAESDVIALFITRYFGQRNFGAIYGYLLATFLVGASAGPALFGFGRDGFGGYATPMIMASIVMAAACLILVGLTRYRPHQAIEADRAFSMA